jgi:hypothetical protein
VAAAHIEDLARALGVDAGVARVDRDEDAARIDPLFS